MNEAGRREAVARSPRAPQLGRGAAAVIWATTALMALSIVAVGVGVLPEPPGTPPGGAVIFLVLVSAFGTVGALIVTRQPRNAIGWLLWLEAGLVALSGAGQAYAVLSETGSAGTLPATAVLAWAGGFSLGVFLAGAALVLPLLFPDVRLPSPRWRWAMANAIAAMVLIVVGSGQAFLAGPIIGYPGIDNPFGIRGMETITELANGGGIVLAIVGLALSVGSQIRRFRRGSSVDRQQVKWFAAALSVPALLLVASFLVPAGDALWTAAIASVGLLPIAIGMAVLRYRLYELDRIVSRTLGWAIATAAVAVVFAVALVLLEAALTSVTQGATLAVAASTLAAFATFQPMRRVVQRVVDRRFDRARYDGQRTSTAFGGRLREQTELAAVTGDLVSTVASSVRPASAAVWLRDGST